MSTPAATARLAHAEDAALRVLEAERAAFAQIEQCKRQSLRLVAESSARAEQVRRRAEARIERLRERMCAAARLRLERMSGEMDALALDTGTGESTVSLLDRAIARLTEEIAGLSQAS